MTGIMWVEDYREIASEYAPNFEPRILESFLDLVVHKTAALSIDKDITEGRFSDDDIT